jgi:hypothetical protein
MQIKLTLYISRVIRLDYKTLIITTAGIFHCLQHQKLMIYIRTHVFKFFFGVGLRGLFSSCTPMDSVQDVYP